MGHKILSTKLGLLLLPVTYSVSSFSKLVSVDLGWLLERKSCHQRIQQDSHNVLNYSTGYSTKEGKQQGERSRPPSRVIGSNDEEEVELLIDSKVKKDYAPYLGNSCRCIFLLPYPKVTVYDQWRSHDLSVSLTWTLSDESLRHSIRQSLNSSGWWSQSRMDSREEAWWATAEFVRSALAVKSMDQSLTLLLKISLQKLINQNSR